MTGVEKIKTKIQSLQVKGATEKIGLKKGTYKIIQCKINDLCLNYLRNACNNQKRITE